MRPENLLISYYSFLKKHSILLGYARSLARNDQFKESFRTLGSILNCEDVDSFRTSGYFLSELSSIYLENGQLEKAQLILDHLYEGINNIKPINQKYVITFCNRLAHLMQSAGYSVYSIPPNPIH